MRYVVFHPWRAATVVLVGIVLGTGAFYAYELNTAFAAVAVEEFNPDVARDAIEAAPPPVVTDTTVSDLVIADPGYDLNADPLYLVSEQIESIPDPRDFSPYSFGEPIPDDVFESYLLLGTDASGFLADAIILALQPSDGDAPIMVSLPRDLYVWNLCRGAFTRLNTGLGGCKGTASGSELMAIMVEDYTGIAVDHLARINFGGFARLVNTMGGITVCVDYPTRDAKSHLDIPTAGCQRVDGATALAWVRSRHTEQLKGGDEWVQVAGSDFARQRRQQNVLFQLAGKAAGFSSPATLANRLAAVSSSVRLDSSWSFGQAVLTGWRYRGISKSSVARFSIEIVNFKTPRGAAVLLPAKPFKEQLESVHPLS
jgi:LCP family protein required for cell wall assembly